MESLVSTMRLAAITIKAGVAYFALVFGAGFILGALRVPLLVPRVGVRMAELIEAPFMLAAIVLAAVFVVRRFSLPHAASIRLRVGVLALGLMLVAEATLALALQYRTLSDYVASRDPVSGGVFVAMLVLYALMPLVVAQTRRRKE